MTKDILNQNAQSQLINLARESILYYLNHHKIPKQTNLADCMKNMLDPLFLKQRSAFVTLYLQGQLRGCVGSLIASQSLVDEVINQSINAAMNDKRFRPLNKTEWQDLTIEISILSPMHQVQSYSEIILEKHGVILQKNNKSAVFLPKVAKEQNWDLEKLLTQLSLKAGLNAKDWQENAQFYVFEALECREGYKN